MNQTDKLNRLIAEWVWPDVVPGRYPFPFTDSFDSCITHIIPKLKEQMSLVKLFVFMEHWLYRWIYDGVAPALAFCLAVEKIIKKEAKQ